MVFIDSCIHERKHEANKKFVKSEEKSKATLRVVRVAGVFEGSPPRGIRVGRHFFRERKKATVAKSGGVPPIGAERLGEFPRHFGAAGEMGDNELGFAVSGDNELLSSVEIVDEFRGMVEFSGGDSFHGCQHCV